SPSASANLPDWLEHLQQKADSAGHPVTVLLAPQQQMIGTGVYEVAFIADADGLPLEFLRRLK
ncbi:MAG: VOC family protein, partial [Cyanobacteria bacterium J06642_11]